MDEATIRNKIEDKLISLGIFPHLKGFKYLVDAVNIVMNTTEDISMTKHLYPEVAKINATTATRVERDIRHAIETAMNCACSAEAIHEMFNNVSPTDKPTNSAFIHMVAFVMGRELKAEVA